MQSHNEVTCSGTMIAILTMLSLLKRAADSVKAIRIQFLVRGGNDQQAATSSRFVTRTKNRTEGSFGAMVFTEATTSLTPSNAIFTGIRYNISL